MHLFNIVAFQALLESAQILPQPDGPTMAMLSPSSTLRLTVAHDVPDSVDETLYSTWTADLRLAAVRSDQEKFVPGKVFHPLHQPGSTTSTTSLKMLCVRPA